ncbi:MAG: hypothetical protein EXQ50_10845 [Acidobacteria bacterium]|nr:hypothetical protein [Acidobacteriota bacterium]
MTDKKPYLRLDLSRARTIPLSTRPSKVAEDLLVKPDVYDPAMGQIEKLFPSILAGRDIRSLADAWASAVRSGRSVVLGMGTYFIKVGLSRLVIDLMERGYLHAVASNGAVAIHELEMALHGETSEDVAEGLLTGNFGMAEEMGRAYWDAVTLAAREDYGFGQALGRFISESGAPHRDLSVLAAAYQNGLPATVHVAMGTDVAHMHPSSDGAALGQATFRDFQVFSEVVKGLDDGGVYLNMGSAVLLPELFLKAINIARNIDGKPTRIVTADMDMIKQYRPWQNVVHRPTMPDGQGYQIVGHYEILFPLLYAMVRNRLG